IADVEARPDAELPDALMSALLDDLNTPEAFAVVARLAENTRKAKTPDEKKAAKSALLGAGAFLGLLQQDPEAWFKGGSASAQVDAAWVEALLAERAQVRKQKNFGRADEIRDLLTAAGVVIEDGPQGARWKIANAAKDQAHERAD
ncbi:MAG TPA: DALR domain-containing protein, partial [Rudaea sp.]